MLQPYLRKNEKMADEKPPEIFSSRLGLILTTVGAAVGTGNIWRFPREAAANGGGSFMIGWLLFLFAWSIPLLMAEFAIGKKTRLAPEDQRGSVSWIQAEPACIHPSNQNKLDSR